MRKSFKKSLPHHDHSPLKSNNILFDDFNQIDLDSFLNSQHEDKIIDHIAINTFNKWSKDLVGNDVKIEKS